jgi:hypothetical protein
VILNRVFVAGMATLICITSARAEGSIGFDEVMQFAAQSQKLVTEIKRSIQEQHVKRADIRCGAARFGNQWTNLGGDRAPPFNCQIGKRFLTINGEIHFFDVSGRRIPRGMENPDVFSKAHSFQVKRPTWSWQTAK